MSSLIELLPGGRQTTDRGDKVPWRDRVPWGDIAILVFSGALLAIFYPFCGSSPDEGLITTAAERILRGQVPYRDFFSELGPGSLYIQAVIFRLGGTSLPSVFFPVWSLSVAITWLLYRLSRKLLPWPLSLLPPVIMIGLNLPYHLLSHHWWGILFVLLMVLCLSSLFASEESHKKNQSTAALFAAGMQAAAALFCMQSLGAWAIVTTVVWLASREKVTGGASWHSSLSGSRRPVLLFLFGAASVIGPAMIYFWMSGAIASLVYDNFIFLFTHYVPYQSSHGAYSWDTFARPLDLVIGEPSLQTLVSAAGYYFFALVGPAIGFAGAACQLMGSTAPEKSRAQLLLLYTLAAAGCFLSQLHEPEILHFIWGAPLVLILFAEAWRVAAMRWTAWRRFMISTAVLALALLALGEYRRAAQAANGDLPVRSRRGVLYGTPRSAAVYQRWIEVIERDVPQGGETFIFPYEAQLYYLTATRNPTRYDALLSDFHSREQFAETVDSIRRERPKYIFNCQPAERYLYGTKFADDADESSEPNALIKILHSGQSPYTLVEKAAGMEVWTLRQ